MAVDDEAAAAAAAAAAAGRPGAIKTDIRSRIARAMQAIESRVDLVRDSRGYAGRAQRLQVSERIDVRGGECVG